MLTEVATITILTMSGVEEYYLTLKCVDHCTKSSSVGDPSAPSDNRASDIRLLGIAFDKESPLNYRDNCDTFQGSFDNPSECRWWDCYLPTSISSQKYSTQMTVAIYIR